MKLVLLHLSDIHFESSSDHAYQRKENIRNAIQNIDSEIEHCILIISGDIAYSGLEKEYEVATQFIKFLIDEIKKLWDCSISIALVPGNHDCNFTKDQQIRNIVIEQILEGKTEITDKIIDECTSVQDNYFTFESSIVKYERKNAFDKLFLTNIELIKKFNISFKLFNTSWLSKKHEKQSELIFPISLLESNEEKADLVISIVHHPFNWLDADNAAIIKQNIEKNSDIILSGHEHNKSSYVKSGKTGINSTYFEAGVFQDKENPNKSEFNVLLIDLKAKKIKIFDFLWENNIYKQITESQWEDFQRNKFRTKHLFQISKEFNDSLNDPGATFTHSKKEIKLGDIFIYPDLKELKIGENSTMHMTSENILDKKYTLIIGTDNIGKTTLCKKLFMDFHQSDYIPLLVNGEDFEHKIQPDKIKRLLLKKVEKQYSEYLRPRYEQLEKTKKVIIVDDFHKISYNAKGKNRILKVLMDIGDRVIILGNYTVQMEEILTSSKEVPSEISKFNHYRILECGSYKKGELIKKWLTLGKSYSFEEAELVKNIFKTLTLVDIIVGKNLIPSYPIFILAILQQIEAQIPIDVNSKSYLYFYESLIKQTLFRSPYKLEIDTKYTFLSFIAYHCYTKRKHKISKDDLKEIYDFYFKKIKRTINLEIIAEDFCRFGLLQYSEGGFKFKYNYVYYYFTAHFMSIYFNDPEFEIKKDIDRLSEKIYIEEFANILLFVSYLSYERYIIDKLLEKAINIYKDYEPCDLDEQVNFLNKIHEKLPEIILIEENPNERLERFLKNQDITGNSNDDEEIVSETEEDFQEDFKFDEELDDILKINIAMKNMQILGQILKNSPGSLSAELKAMITKECYLLGLRSLSVFMTLLNKNIDNFLFEIVETLKKRNKSQDESKLSDFAKEFTFMVVELLSLAFIKNISSSIGTEKLDEIYKDILKDSNNISFRLTDLSIKLDHFESFPETEIMKLADNLSSNFFSFTLLRFLVVDYYHLFSTSFKTKQKICDKLKIPIQKVSLLDNKTKKVK